MPDLNIGGQAVIEGVMMRSADRISTAVRTADGQIVVQSEDFKSLSNRYPWINTPVLRGAVAFVEMLLIGIRTLNFSADLSMQSVAAVTTASGTADAAAVLPKRTHEAGNSPMLILTAVVAVGLGILIFFFTPIAVASLFGIEKNAIGFNLLAGGIRLVMLVGYMLAISMMKDVKRVFEYHGAEHKAIMTMENGGPLTAQRAMESTRFHPRCGTSFLLIVALLAVMTYAVSDTLFAVIVERAPSLVERFLLHAVLLPLIAGLSFELLKMSGKTRGHALTKILIQPGLWLQRITTREPSIDQLEVAIVALEDALRLPSSVPRTPYQSLIH